MVVDLADGVVQLPPRLVEELGVGLDAVPEGLDPRPALLLAVHHRSLVVVPAAAFWSALGFRRGDGEARVSPAALAWVRMEEEIRKEQRNDVLVLIFLFVMGWFGLVWLSPLF